jgi:hypothetical protein
MSPPSSWPKVKPDNAAILLGLIFNPGDVGDKFFQNFVDF